MFEGPFSFQQSRGIDSYITPLDVLVIGIVKEVELDLKHFDTPLDPEQMSAHVENMATEYVMSEVTSGVPEQMLCIPNNNLAEFIRATATTLELQMHSPYESKFQNIELASPALSTMIRADRFLGHFLETVIDDVSGELAERGWGIKRNRK